jgi:hypothetical protein
LTESLGGGFFGVAGAIDGQASNDSTLFPIILSKNVVEHSLGESKGCPDQSAGYLIEKQ